MHKKTVRQLLLGLVVTSAVLAACSATSAPITTGESSLSTASAALAVNSFAAQASLPAVPTTADPTTAESTGEYTQTWAKTYGKTTCTEFRTEMSGHETFVAAADMLVNARKATDASLSFPSDDLITRFQTDLLSNCNTAITANADCCVANFCMTS